MFVLFLYYLLLGISSSLFIYFLGRIVTSFINCSSNQLFRIFTSLITGILFITITYALIKSNGKTILIIVFPIIGFVLFYYRNYLIKPTIKFKYILNDILLISSIFTLIFLYQSWFYFDFFSNSFKSLHSDSYWYSIISNSQVMWGIESYFTECNIFSVNPYNNGLDPYHYPELWLTASFSQLFSISTLSSYYLLTCSILISTYLLGIISLFHDIFIEKWKLFFFSILLLFISGISLHSYDLIPLLRYSKIVADVSIMGLFGLKYAFVLPYILLSFILLKQGKDFLAFSILTCIPIFSIGLLPPVWGGLLLFYSYLLINKITPKKGIVLLIIVVGLTFCLYFTFYALNKSSFSNGFALKFAIEKFYRDNHIITTNFIPFIKNAIVYFLRIGIIFSPSILLSIILFKQNNKLSILSLFIVGCGITTSSIFLGFTDGNQFANNSFIFLIVYFILGTSILLKSKIINSQIKNLFIYLIILLSSYSIFWDVNRKHIGENWYTEDSQFLKKVEKEINSQNAMILLYLDSNGYKKFNFTFWTDHNDLNMINQYTNKNINFTLGNPELYLIVNKINSVVDSFTYYKQTPLILWKQKSINHNLVSFIKHYNIKYVYIKSSVTIPNYFLINAKKIIVSPRTHNTFIKIK